METFEYDGYTFRVERVSDPDAGFPWDNMESLGTVSDWECRGHYRGGKRPGERILAKSDRCNRDGQYRFYDFAGAVANARAEGLNGEAAADAADREFEMFRAWCNDEWQYIGLIVTLLDVDGNPTEYSDALWGIDSDAEGYISTLIGDMVGDIAGLVGDVAEIEVPSRTVRIREEVTSD